MKINHISEEKSSELVFILVFVIYSFVIMTKNCYSAAMTSIVNEGIMTKSQTGLIASMFYIIYAPFQIIGGIAVDKYPAEKLITMGIIGAGIANLLIYFVQNYIAMIIIWSLNAVVQFAIWPGVFKIMTTRIIPSHRVKAIFYIGMSTPAGLLLSYLISMFVTNWKHNFLFSAIILFICAWVFAHFYNKLGKGTSEPQTVREEREIVKSNMLKLLWQSGLLLLLAVYLVIGMLNLGVKTIVPVMLMESYDNVSPAFANGLNIILVLVAPLGIILARNRIFSKFGPVNIITFFIALCVPFLAAITFVGKVGLVVIVASFTMVMLFVAILSPFFSQITFEFNKYGKSGTVSGILNCMAALGIVVANYVFTKLAENAGWIFTVWCWVAVTAFALVLSLISIPIWKKFIQK